MYYNDCHDDILDLLKMYLLFWQIGFFIHLKYYCIFVYTFVEWINNYASGKDKMQSNKWTFLVTLLI